MGKEAVLPKNVRQIGDIQGNRRIYMEDYVMTYIHRKEQREEQGFLGVFLGEKQETEDGMLVFIRGLVEVPEDDAAGQNARLLEKRREAYDEDTDTERELWEEASEEKPEDLCSEELKRSENTKEPSVQELRNKSWNTEETRMERTDEAQSGQGMKEILTGDAEGISDTGLRRSVLQECREFFGPGEIQGCCVIGEYPVKRMERLAEEVPQSRQFLYHLQEQEETLYWTEDEKYEQISGYFVFYEQNKEMQEYMAETFGEEESEQDKVPDKAIKNFREKIRKKDQIRLTGMLKLASSLFVVMLLLVGAVVVNRIEARRSGDAAVKVPENEAQSQIENPTVTLRAGEDMNLTDTAGSGSVLGVSDTGAGSGDSGNTAVAANGEADAGNSSAGNAAVPANGGADAGQAAGADQTAGTGTGSAGNAAVATNGGADAGNSSAGNTAVAANGEADAGQTAGASDNQTSGTGNAAAEDVTVATATTGAGADQTADVGTGSAGSAAVAANGGADAGQVAGASDNQTSGTGTNVSETTAASLIQNGIGGTPEQAATNKEDSVEAASRKVRASYVIREGDTLADICQTYYGGLDKLELICEANAIENADMIVPGQKIVLP